MSNTYYIHLGYDFYSYVMGTVWGNGANQTGNRWLQYCLTAGSSGSSPWTPALFQFSTGDLLYFKIWDLSQYPTGTVLNQICVDSSGGSGVGLNTTTGTPYDSGTSPVSADGTTLIWNDAQPKPHIYFAQINMQAETGPSPWGSSMFSSSNLIGPMTITGTGNMSFKLNFKLQASYNSDPNGIQPPTVKTYIADPEGTVGSGRV